MEQLPKIVGQRLQAVSQKTHPDADLLTAFAEKSLLPREQTSVLEHLAACAACREVVAHAQPEEVLQHVAVAAAAAPSPMRGRSWFQAPALRWAALAACVVVVGTVVLSRSHSPGKSATYYETAELKQLEKQPTPSAPADETRSKATDQKLDSLKAAQSATATKRDVDQVAELDKRVIAKTLPELNEREKNTPLRAFGARNEPARSQTVNVEAAAAPASVTTEEAKASKKEFSADKAMKASAEASGLTVQAQAAPPPPPPPPASKPATEEVLADNRVVRSRGSAGIGALAKSKDVSGYVASAPPPADDIYANAMVAFTAKWQLSAEGQLLRSNDQGKNWQVIPFGDKTIFRALCVTEREVWVGGAQGKLFYSSDAGQRWEQIKPSANGQILTADVLTIEFKDSRHGKLTTSDHQTWSTSDGGHGWQIESR